MTFEDAFAVYQPPGPKTRFPYGGLASPRQQKGLPLRRRPARTEALKRFPANLIARTTFLGREVRFVNGTINTKDFDTGFHLGTPYIGNLWGIGSQHAIALIAGHRYWHGPELHIHIATCAHPDDTRFPLAKNLVGFTSVRATQNRAAHMIENDR